MMSLRALGLGVAILFAGCRMAPQATPITPVTVAPVPSAPAQADAPRPSTAPVETMDGVKLGSPIGVLLKRAPYDKPCDIDPIDHKTATLFFWAAGPCRQAPPFPGGTTLVIITASTPDTPREEQPIVLVAWAGGSYFDEKSGLSIRNGDTREHALQVLGNPTRESYTLRFHDGQRFQGRTLSWQRVHAYVVGDTIVALALGDLPLTVDVEQPSTLERLYQHHLRYVNVQPP